MLLRLIVFLRHLTKNVTSSHYIWSTRCDPRYFVAVGPKRFERAVVWLFLEPVDLLLLVRCDCTVVPAFDAKSRECNRGFIWWLHYYALIELLAFCRNFSVPQNSRSSTYVPIMPSHGAVSDASDNDCSLSIIQSHRSLGFFVVYSA